MLYNYYILDSSLNQLNREDKRFKQQQESDIISKLQTNVPSVLNSLKETNIEVNEDNLHTISHIQYLAFKADEKIKRPFTEKMGDWVCFCCKNLNFSFRTTCNRCSISKLDNAKLGLEITKLENSNEVQSSKI
jgi:hypothetical protein